MKRRVIVLFLVLAVMFGASWRNADIALNAADSARRAICNLLGYTDSFGALAVVSVAAQPPNSARRAIGNLLGKTDSTGALYVALSGTSTVSRLLFADGTVTAPSISFANETGMGFWRTGTDILSLSMSGTRVVTASSSVLGLGSAMQFGWYSPAFAAMDITLSRDAADTLALRRSANAQTIRIYNTYTDASNYERLSIDWTTNANNATLTTQNSGTGAIRNLQLRAGSGATAGLITVTASTGTVIGIPAANHWQFTGTGMLVTPTDNTYDIGAVGATRPRNIYVGTDVTAASSLRGAQLVLNAGSIIKQTSDGNITMNNNAESIGIRVKVDALPTVASGFGTSPAVTAGSTPTAGSINIGTGGTATTGVINFNGTAYTAAPFCVVSDATSNGVTRVSAISTTQLTLSITVAWTASDIISWHCISSK